MFQVNALCSVGTILTLLGGTLSDTTPRYSSWTTDTLTTALQEARSLFGPALDSAQVAKLWVADSAVHGGMSQLVFARLWRRSGEFALAQRSLDFAAMSLGTSPEVELEQARILFAQSAGHESRELIAEAATHLWAACDRMSSAVKRGFWEDIRGLATPSEQAEWEGLSEPAEVCGWIRRFYEERAWRSGMDLDSRLAEHYRRLAWVRSRYWLREPRGPADELSQELGRPAGLEIDDRGLIYLRMGPPDDTALSDPCSAPCPSESWIYRQPGGDWLFHFAPVSRIGGREILDYRLLRNLMAAGGDPAYQYRSRQGLDPEYSALAYQFERNRASVDDDRALAIQQELMTERQDLYSDAKFVIQSIPDVPPIVASVRFVAEAVRFPAPFDSGSTVWFLGAARAGDLDRDSMGQVGVAGSVVCRTPDGLTSQDAPGKTVAADRLSDDDAVLLAIPVRLGPGSYPCTATLRDVASADPKGSWLQDTVTVPQTQRGLPSVSDIAVASDSGGTWTRDGETFLHASPAHVTNPRGFAHIYFEVYGVDRGSPYEVDLRLVPEDHGDRVYEMRASDAVFSLRFASNMPENARPLGTHHLRLDLRDTPRGKYVLAVRVMDLDNEVHSLPATTWIEKL